MDKHERPLLIGIMGCTASGKTGLAEGLADEFGAALINADALQVYRGMDIGTAKPIHKHRYELLDLKNPNESYGSGEFCKLALDLLARYWEQKRNVIVVGGTGLYIRALFEEYDALRAGPPQNLRDELNEQLQKSGLAPMAKRLLALDPSANEKVDLDNPVRVTRAMERILDPRPTIPIKLPPFRKLKLGLSVSTTQLSERIEDRVLRMVQNGWVREVNSLLENNFGPADPGFRAIGYTSIANAILNKTGLEEAIATTIVETRQYAKRQRTWLRSEPELVNINAPEGTLYDEATGAIRRIALGSING